jgi:hypothetical protein
MRASSTPSFGWNILGEKGYADGGSATGFEEMSAPISSALPLDLRFR